MFKPSFLGSGSSTGRKLMDERETCDSSTSLVLQVLLNSYHPAPFLQDGPCARPYTLKDGGSSPQHTESALDDFLEKACPRTSTRSHRRGGVR